MEAPDPSPSRARFGFSHRVAAVFAALAVLLTWLGITVSFQVAEMHRGMGRVLEEHREAAYSRDLLHALRMIEAHVSVRADQPIGESDRITLEEYVASAERALAELRRGPKGEDPSEAEHIAQEERLFDSIAAGFAELREGVHSQSARLGEDIDRVRHHAEVLHEEMQGEALESSDESQSEARSLRDSVIWTTIAALVVLATVQWMVWRSVVRPVQRLREGVARIAGGDLAHRVEVATHDEIGELAGEFNRMAGELLSERTGLEARVDERTKEFLRAARLAGLGTMAAGIAHEINNPLASIASCAEGLERRLDKGNSTPEQQREYLRIIAKEAYRAHDITSRLLDFARSEGGPQTEFPIAGTMRELQVLLEHRLRARRLTLDIECDPSMPSMRGNAAECKQVLLNLVHNAIDASPDGGRVTVRCRREGGEAVLEVEDQGPGIPPEHAGRIFDPFFTTKDPGKGTGLGLAIVHRIVESHGGRTEVENTGHGALFRVHVPNPTA
jgi:signal transduction histidine kinase